MNIIEITRCVNACGLSYIRPDLRSISAQLIERARRENLTIRHLYLRAGITGSARIGTPADIADTMQEWFEADACDGFNITPATLPSAGEDFVDMVVPELRRRGLFRDEYAGTTLRDHLGLPKPRSRFHSEPTHSSP